MKVLLSVRPEFAEKILDGTKKFEFRKKIFRREGIKEVIIYASSPVRKVIGEFVIECIYHEQKEDLWERTKFFAGITKESFDQYFYNVDKGYALKINSTVRYSEHMMLEEVYGKNTPPQSFAYIGE